MTTKRRTGNRLFFVENIRLRDTAACQAKTFFEKTVDRKLYYTYNTDKETVSHG